MKILVTGSNGFIGKNLMIHLSENASFQVSTFMRGEPYAALVEKIAQTDFIVHLAGANRPQHSSEFVTDNIELTRSLSEAVKVSGRATPIIYTSSTQVELDNDYGNTKRQSEQVLRSLTEEINSPVYIYRLPNVFGKWCRPNYNSVVATFCHNLTHRLPLQIHDPNAALNLVYIDDVISDFLHVIQQRPTSGLRTISPVYQMTVGELAMQLTAFQQCRVSLLLEPVGTGVIRALYSTYISYLNPVEFAYPLTKFDDARGSFVEVLKTKDSGQFSYFTAHPGATRGGHYHHTKTEKFIVLQGEARFRFKHMTSGAVAEIVISGSMPQVVETIPGWVHDVTNIGSNEMIVMLWANEIFNRERPDTTCNQL